MTISDELEIKECTYLKREEKYNMNGEQILIKYLLNKSNTN